jgi:hypothetical protein
MRLLPHHTTIHHAPSYSTLTFRVSQVKSVSLDIFLRATPFTERERYTYFRRETYYGGTDRV